MIKTLRILCLFLGIYVPSPALGNYSVGARSVALSNAFVSVSDSWSTFHNQATLAGIKNFSAGVFYESRFLVDELSLAAATATLPLLNGNVGLSFYQFGSGTYNETKFGFAYARQLSERWNAAVQMDYFMNRWPENEKAFGFATFEAGIVYRLNNEVVLGAHVFNPVKNGITTYYGKEKMPLIARIGGHYEFADRVLISAEYAYNNDQTGQVRTGLEFYPLQNLALRMGVSGRPLKYSAGLGYTIGGFTTDIAFSYHGNLGFSPSVSLQYRWK